MEASRLVSEHSSLKILAIETTGQSGSIALLEGEKIIRQLRLPADDRSAKTLAPALREILRAAEWSPQTARLIAVATGPGSFTGLRVGVTTAKTWAYAMRAEVIGVDTLAVIAAQSPPAATRLSAVIDAQRQQVFAGQFIRDPSGRFVPNGGTAIVDNEAWLAGLDAATAVSGPALEKLADRLPADVFVVPREFWTPQAATVGRLGWQLYQGGNRDDLWQLVPRYFRRSAAEEKLDP